MCLKVVFFFIRQPVQCTIKLEGLFIDMCMCEVVVIFHNKDYEYKIKRKKNIIIIQECKYFLREFVLIFIKYFVKFHKLQSKLKDPYCNETES